MLIGSILRRPGRSLMTVIAIMISTSLLISMLSITEGLRNRNRAYLEAGDQDIFIAGTGVRGGIRGGREIAERMEEDSSNISVASPILITSVGLRYEEEIYSMIAIGVIPEKIEPFLTNDGSIELYMMVMRFNEWFKTPGDPHFNNSYTSPYTGEILVNGEFMKKAGMAKGNSIGFEGSSVENFTISGSFESPLTGGGLFAMVFKGIVVMHLSELQSLIGSDVVEDTGEIQDKVSSIVLSVQGNKKKASTVDGIALKIQEEYPLFAVLTKSDRLAMIEEQSEIGDIFYTAVGTVTLVIGLLFVACIMVISVYERQKEIGLLRAIGISRGTIFKQIFSESLVLIVLGACVGIVPGYFGSQYVSDLMAGKYGLDMEMTSFSPGLVIRCMIYVVAIGCLFSLYPAVKASRLEIIDAMRKQ